MIRLGLAAAAFLLVPTSAPAQTAAEVHQEERARFGYGSLRPGADGNDPATYPESVDQVELPPLFTAETQRSGEGWQERRAELARLVEDHWVGRIPEAANRLRIVWTKERAPLPEAAGGAEHWIGRVLAPDGRVGPTIDAVITFPGARATAPSPALIDYTYIWPGGTMPDFGGAPAPDSSTLALRHGFVHVAYRPQLLQPDSAATMSAGLIGLVRWPRERHDWGALRAWAWGASALREELARDPRIAGDRIALQGHSRFGKAVLVAAAFDHAFADANVSSSGAGGAKLMRRPFGERWENMASSEAFHWFTPNIMHYAAGDRSVMDLPVDAHSLIALRAPRPLFLTSGTVEAGDAWVDPTGMWQAARAAQPAWTSSGQPAPEGTMPPPGSKSQSGFPLGWYQHTQGHIPWPGYEAFYGHMEMFAGEPHG